MQKNYTIFFIIDQIKFYVEGSFEIIPTLYSPFKYTVPTVPLNILYLQSL